MDHKISKVNFLRNLKNITNLSSSLLFKLENQTFRECSFYNSKDLECCDFKSTNKKNLR